jgi:metallophosphoesterase superfamily enzyme
MKIEIAKNFIKENADLSNIEIARRLVNEHYPNENVDVLRRLVAFIKSEDNYNEFTEFEAAEMPDSWYSEPNRYELEGKVAVLNDIHVPFHDKYALNTAINYIEKYNPDYLLLNGDIGDFYANSRFVKDPNLRDTAKELSMINQLLDWLQSKFSRIIYKEGNHEARLFDYIASKAPELGNLEGIKLDRLLKLQERNITFVSNRERIKIDKLSVIHGNEIPAGGMINVARTKILRAMGNVLFGHHHVTQDFTQRTIDDKVIGSWAVGCLCGLSPEYAKFNSWNHGFALVETLQGGGFEVQNKRIINNKVM